MTATTLSTARPPRVAIAWATKDAIFVEIPCRDSGPPFICRYHKTTEGLAKALNILIEHQDYVPTVAADPNANHPAIKKSNPRTAWATEDQRAATRNVLRRLKIT